MSASRRLPISQVDAFADRPFAGNPAAVAAAVERLNAELPDGSWFPRCGATRDFDVPTREREEQCQTR